MHTCNTVSSTHQFIHVIVKYLGRAIHVGTESGENIEITSNKGRTNKSSRARKLWHCVPGDAGDSSDNSEIQAPPHRTRTGK